MLRVERFKFRIEDKRSRRQRTKTRGQRSPSGSDQSAFSAQIFVLRTTVAVYSRIHWQLRRLRNNVALDRCIVNRTVNILS